MSLLGKYTKQPAEIESYTIDYSEDLTDGDGIVGADITATPTGLVIEGKDVSTTSVRVWVAVGTHGVKYKVEVTATTGDGRVLQDEFFVTVKEV